MDWNEIISEIPSPPAPLLLNTRVENDALFVELKRPPLAWLKVWLHLIPPVICVMAGLVALAVVYPVTQQLGGEHPVLIMLWAPCIIVVFVGVLWAGSVFAIGLSPVLNRITVQISATQLRIDKRNRSGWLIPISDIQRIKLVRNRSVEIQTAGGFIVLFEEAERLRPHGISFIANILSRATGIAIVSDDSTSTLQGTVRIAGEQSEIRKGDWKFLTAAAVLLTIAWAVFIFGQLYDCYTAQAWPSVEGRVTRSAWVEPKERPHHFDIHYQYVVEGTLYASRRIDVFEHRWVDPDILNTHPVGSQVTVYFNPECPSHAVLYRQWGFHFWMGLASVLAVAILPIIMLRCYPSKTAKAQLSRRYFFRDPPARSKTDPIVNILRISLGWRSALITCACIIAFAIAMIVYARQFFIDNPGVRWPYIFEVAVAGICCLSCYPLYSVWRKRRKERRAERQDNASSP